jgi:deoxyadenosine/deoxycytidine kinase
MDGNFKPLVGIVGPCASGKSTLYHRLSKKGINARHIAQEHSYVPAMWKIITQPDILIFLNVSYLMTIQRSNLDWTILEFQEQLYRLRHANEHADLHIDTDNLSPESIEKLVLFLLIQKGLIHEDILDE